MGAALRIHESWPNFRPLLSGVAPAAGMALPESLVGDAASIAIAEQLGGARRWAKDILDRARALAAQGGPSDIDTTIAALEREEGAFLRDFLPGIRRARRAIAGMRRRNAKQAARMAAEIDWFADVIRQHEEVLRDLRWQLMAVRAETRRDQAGPVFDDPAALRRHLLATKRDQIGLP